MPIIIKKELGEISHFTSSNLPFKYLGVPLSSKSLSAMDCEQIADKMTRRTRDWQGKYLSYVACLQLIYSVLMVISTYWCQTFILSRRVINIVNSICRSFLWFGVQEVYKPGKVNWTEMRKPKKEGGLGIRNLQIWNVGAVGKIAWHLSMLSKS